MIGPLTENVIVPKPKKKLLPKNFEEMLREGNLDQLKRVFDTCEANARGGPGKHTALAFSNCPDELTRWLVAQGADLTATDKWGNTALHERSRLYLKDIKLLLELGADVNHAGASCGLAAARSGQRTSRNRPGRGRAHIGQDRRRNFAKWWRQLGR